MKLEAKQRLAASEGRRFISDVPNESWLNEKIEYARKAPRTRFGVPRMGSITGYFNGPVYVPVRWLAVLKGENAEQDNVRVDDLQAIMKIMKETGKLPLMDDGKREYCPYIEVDYSGRPWISEGNHRIMAADRLGFDYLPIQLRYFDGGERNVDRKWDPENILEIHERVSKEKQ